jgi:hypothetical protein
MGASDAPSNPHGEKMDYESLREEVRQSFERLEKERAEARGLAQSFAHAIVEHLKCNKSQVWYFDWDGDDFEEKSILNKMDYNEKGIWEIGIGLRIDVDDSRHWAHGAKFECEKKGDKWRVKIAEQNAYQGEFSAGDNMSGMAELFLIDFQKHVAVGINHDPSPKTAIGFGA